MSVRNLNQTRIEPGSAACPCSTIVDGVEYRISGMGHCIQLPTVLTLCTKHHSAFLCFMLAVLMGFNEYSNV